MILTDALAEALKTAEVGCLGFGGFHDGNADEMVTHRRDAARILADPAFREALTAALAAEVHVDEAHGFPPGYTAADIVAAMLP